MSDDAPIYFVLVQPEGAPASKRVDLTDRVTGFEYEDNEKKTDLLKLKVDNFDLSNFDTALFKKGNKLIVRWGYPGHLAPERECTIQKVSGALELQVEAQGGEVLMNRITKTKIYENTTRSEVVHALAKEYGFDDAHRDIDETEVVHEHITQARATDAQFIKRLADLEGFEFYVDFEGFHWHKRRIGQKPLRVLQWYLPPDVGDIINFNVENDVFAKPAQVTAKGRDPKKKEDIDEKANDAKTERDANMPFKEAYDEQSGKMSLEKSIANEDTRPTTETNKAQAKKEADGVFTRSIQTTVKLDLDLVGDPGLFAKTVVEVRGLGKRLSGKYYINQANHIIDSSGYKLKVKATTDGTNGHHENLIAPTAGADGGAGKGNAASLEAARAELARKREQRDSSVLKDPALDKEIAALEKKVAGLEQTQSKAKLNEKDGKNNDPNALAQVETFDSSSGQTAIVYKDLAGKTPSKNGTQVK